MRDILAWALSTEILGLAVLPILRSFFGNRRDAALLSRPVGLAAVAWLAWALSLTPLGFRRGTVVLALAAVAAAAWLGRRRAAGTPDADGMRASVWGDEEKLAAAMFWGCAAVFLVIRAAGPAILGQEKFMDLAFLTSLGRFSEMPPADPWMAGKTINYYYWGYLLAATQRKLADVAPMVAYNLSIATFAASSFVAAACLGLRLSRGRLGVGLSAAGLTVFAGNLAGALDAWAAPFTRDFDYFKASRVIGPEQFKTINEFPMFTFFHADLHPHLLAFPYFVAAFAVAHRWIEIGAERGRRRWLAIGVVALIAGTARAASLWNMPALAILLVAGGVLASTGATAIPDFRGAVRGAFAGILVFVLSLVLFYPYTASFQLENKGTGQATMFSGVFEFLGMWGILFAVLAVGLWPPRGEATEAARRRRDLVLTIAAALALGLGLVLRMPAMPIVIALALLALASGWRSLRAGQNGGGEDGEGVYAALLVLLGLGMVAGCEFVYLKDNYGQDLQRMNTIFKFYHQAWPLLAIGGAVLAGRAWDAAGRRRAVARAVLAAAGVLAILWPVNAAVSRLRQRDGAFTLDARIALARRSPADAKAIEWLTKNAPRGSVVLEASGDPYSEYARIATHTGIPTVMGWANHEGLWRGNDPEIGERLGRVKQFYTTPDLRAAYETLRKYGVTHVVVGDMERRTYPGADTVARYPFLQPAFPGETSIFTVARAE